MWIMEGPIKTGCFPDCLFTNILYLKGYSIPLIKGLLKARICPIISENNETEKNRWFKGGKNHAQKPKIALLRRPEVKLSKK